LSLRIDFSGWPDYAASHDIISSSRHFSRRMEPLPPLRPMIAVSSSSPMIFIDIGFFFFQMPS